MEYKNPYLFFLGLIPLTIWVLEYWKVFKTPQLHIPKNFSSNDNLLFLRGLIFLLGVASWLLISYALTGPRRPQNLSQSNIEVNDIFMVLDVSRSMQADDFYPNRLEAAKEKISEFVGLMPTDRIGVIIFSEKVFTLLPLTTDLSLIREAVKNIQIGPLGSGTNMGDALGLATARALGSEAKNKIIVFLTDGVNTGGSMDPLLAAEQAQKYKIKIYSIAMGKADSKLPLGRGRYQNMPGGSVDVETLQKISQITGGKTYLATDSKALKDVLTEISELEKTKVKTYGQVVYDEKYYLFLLIGGLLLFFVEFSRRFFVREFA